MLIYFSILFRMFFICLFCRFIGCPRQSGFQDVSICWGLKKNNQLLIHFVINWHSRRENLAFWMAPRRMQLVHGDVLVWCRVTYYLTLSNVNHQRGPSGGSRCFYPKRHPVPPPKVRKISWTPKTYQSNTKLTSVSVCAWMSRVTCCYDPSYPYAFGHVLGPHNSHL